MEEVLNALSLRFIAKVEEFPESEFTCAEWPGDWRLIVAQRNGTLLSRDKVFAALSRLGDVVTCTAEEHVMCSYAACWKSGQLIWSVYHGGGPGIFDLEAKGELPTNFTEIRNRLWCEQEADGGENADSDCIFNIPVELAHSITGFRHDEGLPKSAGVVFRVLEQVENAARRSWFTRLFAR